MSDVEKVARAIPDEAVEAALVAWYAEHGRLRIEWPDGIPSPHRASRANGMRAAIEAALAAMGERGAAPHPDEPRPKHLCQMIRDGLAAGACLAIAEPDEDGFLARSLILPTDEVEEMLRLAEGTGVTQALADLRRQLHHKQAELMLATSPRPEAVEEAVKALEFYADKDRWEEYRDDIRASIYDRDTGSVFGRDTGETARMALAKLKVEQR